MIDEKTFGSTPAAAHLVRQLNNITDARVQRSTIRSVGIAIKGFNNNLSAIRDSRSMTAMSAKVAANLLRLLRNEASTLPVVECEFITNLTRNVIIGNIKRVIREVTLLRKIEAITVSIDKVRAKAAVEAIASHITLYSISGYKVGYIQNNKWYPLYIGAIADPVTPELLHRRSAARQERTKEKTNKA